MQQTPRDAVYQLALRSIAGDWPEMGAAKRREALARFPELAGMGLKLTDPMDADAVARDAETTAQCRVLDGAANESPLGDEEPESNAH